MTKNSILYTSVFVICSGCLAGWLSWGDSQEKEQQSSQSSMRSNSSERMRSSSEADDWTSLVQESVSSRGSEDFASRISGLSLRQLFEISFGIRASFKEDSEGTAAWLESAVLAMAEDEDHQQAAQLLNFLGLTKEIPNIERKLYHDWLESGGQEAFEMAANNTEIGKPYDHQFSLLASMVQKEFPDQLESYISLVEASANPDVTGTAILKIVTHLEPENIDFVGEVISRNLNNGRVIGSIPSYALKHSQEDRTKTLDWVAELPITSFKLKADLLGGVVQQIAIEDPDKAGEVLNSELFLTKYYPGNDEPARTSEGEWSVSAQRFFDVTLRSFINGALHTDLEFARSSANSFFDPTLRKEYGAMLDEIINARQKIEN